MLKQHKAALRRDCYRVELLESRLEGARCVPLKIWTPCPGVCRRVSGSLARKCSVGKRSLGIDAQSFSLAATCLERLILSLPNATRQQDCICPQDDPTSAFEI